MPLVPEKIRLMSPSMHPREKHKFFYQNTTQEVEDRALTKMFERIAEKDTFEIKPERLLLLRNGSKNLNDLPTTLEEKEIDD